MIGPTVLLAAILAIVLGLDPLVGAVEPLPEPQVDTRSVEPVAGSSLCTVGVGGVGAPPTELPDLPAAEEPGDDTDEDGEDGEDGEEDGEDGEEAPVDEPEPTATIIAARPGGPGATPAQLERIELDDGEATARSMSNAFPGADTRFTAHGSDEPAATWLRWREAPVAIGREWRISGVEGLPDATVAGGCAASSAGTHVIPGLSTAGGDDARIRLANPHRSAASVAVRFAVPGAPESPLALQNVSVPPNSVREVVVGDTLPEREDLAAIVEVRTGRLAVEGIQVARAAIGGVSGASLLAATTEPAEDWTIPWLLDDDDAEGWLWIVNTGERTAPVELTLHTPDGGQVPDGLAEVSVPPGELRRVDLTGTFPEEVREVGVTARSNGIPIVVSGGVIRTADDPARTAYSIQLGGQSDPAWVLSGTGVSERREELRLVNPEAEPAVVNIALFDGFLSDEPEGLQGIEVPPGSTRVIDLSDQLTATARWSAFVEASEGRIVVGRVGSDGGEGPLHLAAVPGIASATWRAEGVGLAPVQRPGLLTRLGTTGSRVAEDAPAGLIGSQTGDEQEEPESEGTEGGVEEDG
ncbi:MAG: DUF5719 family protein [Nitriliruptoraceae bacterium]